MYYVAIAYCLFALLFPSGTRPIHPACMLGCVALACKPARTLNYTYIYKGTYHRHVYVYKDQGTERERYRMDAVRSTGCLRPVLGRILTVPYCVPGGGRGGKREGAGRGEGGAGEWGGGGREGGRMGGGEGGGLGGAGGGGELGDRGAGAGEEGGEGSRNRSRNGRRSVQKFGHRSAQKFAHWLIKNTLFSRPGHHFFLTLPA